MTNNYHTAIVAGQPNSVDVINTPLGSLDAAITGLQDDLDSLVLTDGVANAEVTAARTAINYAVASPAASLSVALEWAAGDDYNVMAYGAAGDNTGNDATAIQAAITAAAAAGGGDVIFPRGTYRITAGLTMASNVNLVGKNGAVVNYAGSAAGSGAMATGTNLTDVEVRNLTWRNTTGQQLAVGVNFAGTSTERCRVIKCRFEGANGIAPISSITYSGGLGTVTTSSNHGLSASTATNIWVTNTSSEYDGGYGTTYISSTQFTFPASVDDGTIGAVGSTYLPNILSAVALCGEDCFVEGCHFEDGISTGVRLAVGCLRGRVLNNSAKKVFRFVMWDSSGSASAPHDANYNVTTGAHHNVVANNVVDQVYHIFGKIEFNCYYNLIANNTIMNCNILVQEDASIIVGGAYCKVSGNMMHLPLSQAVVAIEPLDSGWHVQFDNNHITGTPGGGINVRAGCQNVYIANNVIDNVGTWGIIVNGSTSTSRIRIIGNTVSDAGIHGIFLNDGVTKFIVANNLIDEVTEVGIDINDCDYGTVSGNVLNNIGKTGIYVRDTCSFISIIGNAVYDVDNAGTAADSVTRANIGLAANQDRISIVGNVAHDTANGSHNIRGLTQTNGAAVGNVTSIGFTYTGTNVSAANNI